MHQHITAVYQFSSGKEATAHIRVHPWKRSVDPEFFSTVKIVGVSWGPSVRSQLPNPPHQQSVPAINGGQGLGWVIDLQWYRGIAYVRQQRMAWKRLRSNLQFNRRTYSKNMAWTWSCKRYSQEEIRRLVREHGVENHALKKLLWRKAASGMWQLEILLLHRWLCD